MSCASPRQGHCTVSSARTAAGSPDTTSQPVAHDLVVVDETSMVSLPLMARLLDAVRPDSTLVLVGDPYQLASVEAGAVLGEIVGPSATGPADGRWRLHRCARQAIASCFLTDRGARRRHPLGDDNRRWTSCATTGQTS